VYTRPDDLSDLQVADAVHAAWGVRAEAIEWAAVGFGSHHWRITADGDRWFVTMDDLVAKARQVGDPLRRLAAALSTARALRDVGLDFVVAPERTVAGEVLHVLDDRFALAVYPHVEGEPHEWGAYPTREERLGVLDLVAALHRAPEPATTAALADDFAIPGRPQLHAAVEAIEEPWRSGPFGEPARALLRRHRDAVDRAVERYDRLAEAVQRRGRVVLTHGEPHRANTITTAAGPVLIDWETALLAPPERDLWGMAAEDPRTLEDYEARTGVATDHDAVALYALWWDLTEVCVYTAELRRPHRESEDTRLAWQGLQDYLTAVVDLD
jgi:spectinomycin phosphotransferase